MKALRFHENHFSSNGRLHMSHSFLKTALRIDCMNNKVNVRKYRLSRMKQLFQSTSLEILTYSLVI